MTSQFRSKRTCRLNGRKSGSMSICNKSLQPISDCWSAPGLTRANTERWLTAVPLPLETQICDHKAQLGARIASLQKINDQGGRINEEVANVRAHLVDVEYRNQPISGLIRKVREVGPSVDGRAAGVGKADAFEVSALAKTTPIESAVSFSDGTQPVPVVVASDAATTETRPTVAAAFDKTVRIDNRSSNQA